MRIGAVRDREYYIRARSVWHFLQPVVPSTHRSCSIAPGIDSYALFSLEADIRGLIGPSRRQPADSNRSIREPKFGL